MLGSWQEHNTSKEQIKNNDFALWMIAIFAPETNPLLA